MRQHYIPQFILRNFANENNEVRFSSSDDKKSKIAKVENVFQEWDMYVDETLEDPFGIEKSLARFECDIAPIFKKINEMKEKNVWLEMDEYYSLIIFLRLLYFRTKDFIDLAKDMKLKEELFKSLYGLSKCRSIEDLKGSNEITPGFKDALIQDIFWYYIVPTERLGRDDFIISSTYPASCEILSRNVSYAAVSVSMPALYFYPISPSRMIILTHKYPALLEPENNYPIKKGFLKNWGMYNKRMRLPIWKMCGKDVRFANDQIKKYGRHGYVSAL